MKRNFKAQICYLLAVALIAFMLGCGHTKSVIKTRVDSTSNVKAKIKTDSLGVRHITIDSLGKLSKNIHLKYVDRRIDIFLDKPDSNGKQAINHETIIEHTSEATDTSKQESIVKTNKVDSTHLKKDANTVTDTHVKKSSLSSKVVSTGLSLGWKGYLILGVIVIILGGVAYWKFVM